MGRCGDDISDHSGGRPLTRISARRPTRFTPEPIEIRPNDVVYGGQFGFETFLSNPFLDRFFAGAYYPKHVVDMDPIMR